VCACVCLYHSFMCFLSIGWDQNYSMGSCANINDVLSSLLPFCARTSITSVSLKKRSNFRNHHDILGLPRVRWKKRKACIVID
jgi:hypothetical protein